jgi:hypothetical protein
LMTCNKCTPSFTKKSYRFGFLLKYKVAKWGVNGKVDFTVMGPSLLG